MIRRSHPWDGVDAMLGVFTAFGLLVGGVIFCGLCLYGYLSMSQYWETSRRETLVRLAVHAGVSPDSQDISSADANATVVLGDVNTNDPKNDTVVDVHGS